MQALGRARARLKGVSDMVILSPVRVPTLTEAKSRLSALIDHVRGGGRLARLQRAGTVRPASGPVAREVLASDPPRARAGASGVQALIEERRVVLTEEEAQRFFSALDASDPSTVDRLRELRGQPDFFTDA